LNRRHRRPHPFDFADLSAHILVTLGTHRGGNVAAVAPSPQSTAFRGRRSPHCHRGQDDNQINIGK
jgi:hypothetical protein